MDVLSDVLASMRTGRPHSARTERHGPWATSHPAFDGAGFHILLQGACWLTSDGGSPIALGAGDVVLLRDGIAHTLADDPATLPTAAPALDDAADSGTGTDAGTASTVLLCGAYRMDGARSHPLLDTLPRVIHLPTRVGRHPSLRAAVDLLGGELERPRLGADAVLPALLDVLLLYVVRAWYDDQAVRIGHPWAAALRDPVVSAALRAIHDDPARPWTVQELGERGGLSRAPFARRFSMLVGRPPLTYLTWWRMTLAARLLRTGDAPLGAVARQIGYASEYAFAAAFKREYGTAPGHYRRAA